MKVDVVIVGSGPAGTAAAFPLVEAGLTVVMVDAGQEVSRPPLPPHSHALWRRQDPEQWRLQLGDDFVGVGDDTPESPKLKTPFARRVTGGFGRAYGLVAEAFTAFGALAAGGLSPLWGGAAFALKAAELDGWPFGLDELMPSYRTIAARIGIAGLADDDMGRRCGPAVPLLPPTALSINSERLLTRYGRRRHLLPRGFCLGRSWTAVRTVERDGGAACNACNMCLWGCRLGAIWSAVDDIDRLRRFPNFHYRPGLFVDAVIGGAAGARVAARAADGGHTLFAARAVMVAAGTIGTSRLILDALGRRGRPVRLLSNPIFARAFILPGRMGAAVPERGFAMQQLTYSLGPAGGGAPEAFGSLFTADALPPSELAAHMPLSRRGALQVTRLLLPAVVIANAFLPGSLSANHLTVTGDGGIAITGGYAPGAARHVRRISRRLRAAMGVLGALPLPDAGGLPPAGADVHYAGTLPMGEVTSVDGEVAGLAGVFAVDGAVLPALPAKNLTLTIMANADRIGRRCAARLISVGKT